MVCDLYTSWDYSDISKLKITINLPCMNLIISACPSSGFKESKINCGFPLSAMLVARLLQSAVIYAVTINVLAVLFLVFMFILALVKKYCMSIPSATVLLSWL